MKKKNTISILLGLLCITFVMDTYGQEALPTQYDLRNEKRVTSVKDQGRFKGCWAFASLSSLESNIKTKENLEVDLSENNMIVHHGFDLASIDGGNMYMATAYMTRGDGPILEEKDPYSPDQTPVNHGTMKSDYDISDVIFIPKRMNFKDNDKIKQMVREHGAVYTNLKWDDTFYNDKTKAYCNNSLKGYDHTVAIVGWDDNYQKENFNNKETPVGAFICKNNWGTRWGEQGYFYVSYYDFNIGKTDNGVFIGSSHKGYDNIYQYDSLGQTKEYGFSSEEGWFSNVFKANGDEKLEGVGFYTTGENTDYEIWLCRDFENKTSFNNKEKITSGQLSTMGYHKIPLDNLKLVQGEQVGIIVKVKTRGIKNPIAIESPEGSFSSKAEANKDQSFVSVDGEKWYDLTEFEANSNVCLKLFTKDVAIVNQKGKLTIEQVDKINYSKGKEASINVKITNEENKAQKVALVVGLYDSKNKMVNHSYMNQEIKGQDTVTLSASLWVPQEGNYTLKGFVWDDSDNGICYMEKPIQAEIK